MTEAQDVEAVHIERGVSDLRFATGEGQWPEEERRLRETEGKPTLTFNAMPQSIRKVTGQIRQLNPSIKVSASDDESTEEVAEIYEGLIREIEYRCDAQSIYESAAESAAQCSIGHFRIRSDYVSYDTFDQHIIIERVYNPFSVFYDPRAKEPTRSDAEYCFVIDEMGREAFKEQYPDAALSDWTSDHKPESGYQWTTPDNVVVAEYFWRDYDEIEIAQTPNGQVIEGPFPKGVDFPMKRKTRKPKVMWAKVSGDAVLEGPTKVPGLYIPVLAVTGEEIHIGEETYRSGVIRHAKDAQISYNVMRNASIETTMLQPRAPYIGTIKQFTGVEKFWEEANRANRPYLPYNVDPQAPGAPQRQSPPMASQALISEAQIAAEDIKRTTGIHDASLGARSNETSGVAIQSRQMEADIATSVYSDNMVKAINHAGRIIVSMIPEVYDTQRVIRILGEDDQEKIVRINEVLESEYGPITQNDVTAGKYAVRVSVGPTYASKKQEASAGMNDFMARLPNSAPLIADLVAGAQEWPNADRIAARLKKTLPPGVMDDDEQENPDPQQQQRMMQEQQQAQMQQQAQQAQMQMQMQMAQAEMQKAQAQAEEAQADAAKAKADAMRAQAEAEKTIMELRAMQGQIMNAGQPALIPAYPGQPPGQGPY